LIILAQLGHFGLCVVNLDAQIRFYTRTFNLVPSDYLQIPHPNAVSPGKKMDVGWFAHIDRGDKFVDHHSFFMSKNPVAHIHHSSFEVHDFDTQLLGHQ
jgi:hypothetical protein